MKHYKKLAISTVLSASIAFFNTIPAAAQSPKLLGVDHVGINVPDLAQAQQFFADVLGFKTVTQIGPIALDAQWKKANNINPATGPVTIKMVSGENGANIELFTYSPNKGNLQQPGGDDAGATHIAFYTPDIVQSVAYLKTRGVQFLGEVFTTPAGDTAGESWIYFLTPWQSKMELVSYPNGKGYEKNNPQIKLWSPKDQLINTTKTNHNMENNSALSVIEKHLQIWNEKDLSIRNKIITAAYASNIEMVDRHFIATGAAEINNFVNGLQQKNPNARFTSRKPADTHHDVARLFWQFGEAGKAPLTTGMDLFVIENGKVQKLYVFVDDQPELKP